MRPYLEPEARGRRTVAALLLRPVSHDLGVDCTAHTVYKLGVKLGKGIPYGIRGSIV